MSYIAIANAFFRARESTLPLDQRILEDPFAERLVRARWRLRALWALRWVVPGLRRLFEELQTVHCVRHAAVDRLVESALASGTRQVVILGAGLDARAEGRFVSVLRWLREIPLVYFTPESLEDLARETRWRRPQTWGFDEQVVEFAPTAQGRPHGLSQDVALFLGAQETG